MSENPTIRLPAIAILGAGSMGRAILSGLRRPEVQVDGRIRVTNRSAERAAEFADEPDVAAFATEDDPRANLRAVDGVGIVLIAVKPNMVVALIEEIADALQPGTIVVSVAAGVAAARFEELLPEGIPVLRAMPNTPAIVGCAVTGVSGGARASADDIALMRRLFETVGEVVEVPEDRLDALSTISGSGPAYFFYLVEQFTAAAIDKGFSEAEAARLVNGTFRGAAELLAASGKSPAELRGQVTSPNGTTERAVAVLQTGEIKELFDRATDAALDRARELSAPSRDAG